MVRLSLTLSLLLLSACDGSTKPGDETDVPDETGPIGGDEDGDGFPPSEGDCDDANANVFPGAEELCNGVDDNCDDEVDEGALKTFFQDFDADGFGNPEVETVVCDQPAGYVENATDCDDNEPDAYPGGTEICDEIDNNCDGAVDEGLTFNWYVDVDGDGYGDPAELVTACEAPEGTVEDNTDCDDSTGSAYPGNAEVCDELDNNCDGTVDEGVSITYYADFDADGFGSSALTQEACAVPTGYTVNDTDCDDGTAAINPDATETCNDVDDDCDGTTDEDDASGARTWYADADGDTYGNPSVSTVACAQPVGYVADATDCDDARVETNPAATEYCNTYDDDCDGSVDEDASADASTWYLDADGDSYGNAAVTDVACTQPTGFVADATDCNDATGTAHPGADELCDTLDNDCDGTVDEDSAVDARTWYADADSDTYGNAAVSDVECYQPTGYVSNSTDCDDARAATYPGAAEYCNTYDDDCDGSVDEESALDARTWYADADADTYGNASVTDVECYAPSGYVANATDCDDGRAATYPGATEYCNTYDDDCDGTTDEDAAADARTWYIDSDRDTYGNASVSDIACYQPSGYVADATDCNDGASSAYPGATERCDSLDNDCDGSIDEDSAADAATWYRDADGDAYGNASVTDISCTMPSGYVANATDCNDGRAATYPGAPEYCNTHDDDCDGTIDEESSLDARTWYRDADADTYGNASITDVECYVPSGYVANATDCNDSRALTNPGATEYCNSIDDDCDGTVDEDAAADAVTWYRDADGDTYGNPTATDVSCTVPSGYVADNTDCLDTSVISYPGADEICDSLDNDCDGTADDNPVDGDTYYDDDDADGFGDPADSREACGLPTGYSANAYDCNDTTASEPVVADPVDGSPSGAGTLGDPFDSLQDAIDDANECVVAYGGTYLERIDLDGKSIDVWGVEGEDLTTIDANLSTCGTSNPTACAPAVRVDSGTNAAPTLHGFTITGGTGAYSSSSATTTCADSSASHSGSNSCTVTTYEYCGGGVYVDGDDPVFYDVIVRDNTLPVFEQASTGRWVQTWMYSFGGGVCLKNSNASFEGSMIEGNFADAGGGIFAESSSSFSFAEGYVSENDAVDGGGVHLSGASASFTNAIVHCNAAETDGGGLYTESSGTATFTNTVFFGNTSSTSGTTRGSQAYIGSSTTFNLYNSIVQASSTVYAVYGAGSGTHTYSNVYNASGVAYGGTLTAGTGGISSGSNFTSATCDGNAYNDNFTLRSTSASINTGNPSSSYNDANGTRNDMGAFGGPGSGWSL